MVLYRRAAQRQTIISAEQTSGFGVESPGILNRLSFVENAVVETQILELQRIASQRAVCRQHDVVLVEMIAGFDAPSSGGSENSQFGRKLTCLCVPVKDQRSWHNHQRGTVRFFAILPAEIAARFQKRKDLNRLTQSHVDRKRT